MTTPIRDRIIIEQTIALFGSTIHHEHREESLDTSPCWSGKGAHVVASPSPKNRAYGRVGGQRVTFTSTFPITCATSPCERLSPSPWSFLYPHFPGGIASIASRFLVLVWGLSIECLALLFLGLELLFLRCLVVAAKFLTVLGRFDSATPVIWTLK